VATALLVAGVTCW